MPWIFSEIVHTFSFFFTCPLAKRQFDAKNPKLGFVAFSKAPQGELVESFLAGLVEFSKLEFQILPGELPIHFYVLTGEFFPCFFPKKDVFFWHCFAVGRWSAWQWSCGDSMLGIYRSWMNLEEFGPLYSLLSVETAISEVLILQQVLHQQEETSRIVVQDTHDAGWMYLPNGQDHRGEFGWDMGPQYTTEAIWMEFSTNLSDLCRYNS